MTTYLEAAKAVRDRLRETLPLTVFSDPDAAPATPTDGYITFRLHWGRPTTIASSTTQLMDVARGFFEIRIYRADRRGLGSKTADAQTLHAAFVGAFIGSLQFTSIQPDFSIAAENGYSVLGINLFFRHCATHQRAPGGS